jgi:Bardet-Biedl syndrome 7 protein
VSKESVVHTLGLISPKLEAHLKLAKQVQLIDGLREIQLHEGDVSFLAPEYQEILKNADHLKAEFNRQPCYLDRLYGEN